MSTNNPCNITSVYGPVLSWRVGQSLGIDLICETSVCSFNCVYCQLGSIQVITNERKEFLPSSKILEDFRESAWQKADIITYSGSGEPTLARNLGEVARGIKEITNIPQLVLTNGTLLNQPQVIEDLAAIDRVYIKLDAATDEMFKRVNRPVGGISLPSIVQWIKDFKKHYDGRVGIQTMFLPLNLKETDRLADLLIDIQPDEVQLNTPTRPYPKYWHVASRGGHNEDLRPYASTPLRTISQEQAEEIETRLKEKTGLHIVSVYQK